MIETIVTLDSLFDSKADWINQPLVAAAGFIASPEFVERGRRRPLSVGADATKSKPLSASSAKVYVTMFGAFARWMAVNQISLFSLSPADLDRFLNQREPGPDGTVRRLNSGIRLRYLRLIERILDHLGVIPNPAQSACFALYKSRTKDDGASDAPKALLEEGEQEAFFRALPAVKPTANASAQWKTRRDRALQAVMLGAGLKVSEALALRKDQVGRVDANGSLPIQLDAGAANRITRPHRTYLRPIAVPELLEWLAARNGEGDSSKLLFPAARGTNTLLDPATVYRKVKATFERAGIDPTRWGGRTLRNSFAVRELAETGSVELVNELMGHRLLRSTQAYQDAARAKHNSTRTAVKERARRKA